MFFAIATFVQTRRKLFIKSIKNMDFSKNLIVVLIKKKYKNVENNQKKISRAPKCIHFVSSAKKN